jgi:hypothetical protein
MPMPDRQGLGRAASKKRQRLGALKYRLGLLTRKLRIDEWRHNDLVATQSVGSVEDLERLLHGEPIQPRKRVMTKGAPRRLRLWPDAEAIRPIIGNELVDNLDDRVRMKRPVQERKHRDPFEVRRPSALVRRENVPGSSCGTKDSAHLSDGSSWILAVLENIERDHAVKALIWEGKLFRSTDGKACLRRTLPIREPSAPFNNMFFGLDPMRGLCFAYFGVVNRTTAISAPDVENVLITEVVWVKVPLEVSEKARAIGELLWAGQ